MQPENAPAFLRRLVDVGRRLLASMLSEPGRFDGPGQPQAPVREPRPRSPRGLQSGVALQEPEPPEDVLAAGRHFPQSGA